MARSHVADDQQGALAPGDLEGFAAVPCCEDVITALAKQQLHQLKPIRSIVYDEDTGITVGHHDRPPISRCEASTWPTGTFIILCGRFSFGGFSNSR
jgi:hypothetical protein